ncbi:DUF4252 domain-containing protein [Flavobacterium sp. '19STA2R22 D10 B1']|uniref:DUF4252 domain-containing protein n=1 Tax=Flavobacterium aerium TaxID=3037261 RepID=UPI00278C43E9|nr:DUF4252 domain-containing protein [Flavobacterium sp. '19STA2R22 D10 B1']
MKKFIITLVIALMPTLFFAQSAFDKFDGQDNVTSVVVSKKMFEMMSKVEVDKKDKEAQQYLNLAKKLDNLKVFVTQNNKVSADMRSSVDKYLKSNALEELMRVNDSGKNVKIYVKSGGSTTQIKELLMFIEGGSAKGDDTVLMSLTGDFDINEISVLTKKMNLPGGEELKKAAKK